MLIRTLFLLVPMLWSVVAGATGGVLYTCSMKKETTLNRCCCPSKKATQRDAHTFERVCCEATQLQTATAPVLLQEGQRLAPVVELALPFTPGFELPPPIVRPFEVVARATAPPAREGLYLRIRTLLI